LEILQSELVVDGVDKELILLLLEYDAWEQVINDTSEQGQIVFEELGHIGVSHGSDEQLLFGHGVVLSSQLASHDEDGLDSTHAEVIMVLLGQLL
jgi:hypothetical protein